MEGELESLKSDPYLRLYEPLKHISLGEGFKIFVYNIQKYKTKDVNKILNVKLFDVIIIQKEVVGLKTSKMLLKKCNENDIEVIFELDDFILEDKIKEWRINTENFKISIILPVYNMEKYLRKTLESIEMQTIGLENLEVIMVNEASSDGSKSIIDEYSDKYENFIAIHLSESSGTPGKPRNIGMEMARGEYIMFIDHDDFYSDDACEVLYNKISKERADIVSGIYNFVHGSEIKELPDLRDDKRIFKNQTEIKVKNIAEKEELLTLPPVVWSKIFRRSFIRDNFLTFPEAVLAEDLIFLSNAFLKAEGIIFLNQAIYNYRILDQKEETSLSHARNKEWFMGVCDARKTIWDIYQKEGKEKYFKLICQYSLKYLLNAFTRSHMEFDDKYEVLDYMYWIFKKSDDYGLLPSKKFVYLFKLILKKEYKNVIIISEILRNYKLI